MTRHRILTQQRFRHHHNRSSLPCLLHRVRDPLKRVLCSSENRIRDLKVSRVTRQFQGVRAVGVL